MAVFLVFAFFLLTPVLPAQTEDPPEAPEAESPETETAEVEAPPAPEESGGTGLSEERVIELDIKTSTLQELADWCRSLGISEGGGREELAARLMAHYNLEADEEAEAGRFIIIESARSTEYFTLNTVDEEYARLRGNVVISLKDAEATHRISAQEVLFNRTRNLVTARGGVSYVKEEGDTVETFRGESITVNLDSWATTLTDGISERALSGDTTTYRFEGTVISRSEEEVTILKDASITNASTKNSYWSLDATKLWLLPGSDFALQNAVLKVGEIPLFYLPFFYYPADEIIFHPVLGYRSREGNFIQTTTYILGRPKPEDIKESSLTKILGSGAGMEKEQHGIFLRSTGKKAVNPTETSLKALLDAYSNLGFYAGLEMKSPGIGILKNFEFSLGLGRTRDIRPATLSSFSSLVSGASYTPYPRLDGESDWNSSQFFSWQIPLRYRFKTTGSISGKMGELSWEFPYYSDPFVDRDFLNRSEFMDWFRVIQEGAAVNETTSDTTLSGYQWRLSGRIAVSAPKILAPYLTTLSFSNFYSSLTFNYRDSALYQAAGNTYSPSRRFYFPDKLTLYSLSLGIGGTPLTLGNPAASGAAQREEAEDPLKDTGTLKPPWEERETPAPRQAPASLEPPALAQRFDLGGNSGPRFSVDYRINPAAISELQYRTGTVPGTGRYHWEEAEDVNWEDISSILSTVRGDAYTSFSLNDLQGAYTNTFRLRGSGAYQNYLFTDRDAEEFASSTGVRQALDRIYNATFFTTGYDYSGTVKPLYRNEVWRDTSLSYSFDGLLAKSIFDTTSVPAVTTTSAAIWDATPRWDIEYGAWDKEHLNSHQVSAVLNANVMDKIQNLTLTLALPPRDASLSGNFTTRIWIGEFNANMRIQEPWEAEKRKLDPLYLTGTLRFGNLGYLRHYMVFNMDEKEYQTLTTQLSLWGFTAGFTAVHGIPYEFDYNPATMGGGWVRRGDPVLYPQDLRLGFSKSVPTLPFQDKRLSLAFNVTSSLLIDLQRYTYSRFDMNLGFTFKFQDVLDLTFSVTSDNSVVYRYIRNIPGLELPITTVGETNVLRDLLNSFRFDNPALRTESGFKLKSLNVKATHYMGDWNATLGIGLAPYLKPADTPGGIPAYQFNTQISFVVQWLPISEIKSELAVDKDQWVFK